MAEMQTMRFTGEHWLILDAIAKSPSGIATTAEIQTHFGCAAWPSRLRNCSTRGSSATPTACPSATSPPAQPAQV